MPEQSKLHTMRLKTHTLLRFFQHTANTTMPPGSSSTGTDHNSHSNELPPSAAPVSSVGTHTAQLAATNALHQLSRTPRDWTCKSTQQQKRPIYGYPCLSGTRSTRP